jgi:histone chaperone ASF1
MSKVHLVNVTALTNQVPAFSSNMDFEITFDCMENLPEDLEWKLIFVGSADSSEHDQILDTVYVGPVPEGRHKFVFSTDPPNPAKIPVSDVVGVTVILLTCSYRSQEFVR